LPLGPLTRSVLGEARDLSGEATVASEAVLLALLRTDPELRRYLEPLGLRLARLEADVLARQTPPLALDEPLKLGDLTEQVDLARVLDAAANRAREGLRVVEDYCRFVLDDAFLSRTLKQMRHDLNGVLAGLGAHLLLARETQRDVGTGLATEDEGERYTLLDVARANLKRAQEALRTLEEFGKMRGPGLGWALEQLRYRSYTVERAVVLGTGARRRLEATRLYVLVSGGPGPDELEVRVKEAVAGGAQVVQLREKGLPDRELWRRALAVRRWTREAGALFVVNDRPDLARLAEADGVHLGQDDLPVKEARRVLGPEALVGVSTHDLGQVRQAVLDGASYIGVGPAFPSRTKDFAELAGLDFVRQALAETTLPAFVIGGVNLETIGAAVAAGARRVAVSHALAGSDDPRGVAARLLHVLLEADRKR
jgi:thiamine-phosphate pyrophosphorylase